MSRSHPHALLRLQDSLLAADAVAARDSAALPFEAGGANYALAFKEVQRVQLLSGMVALTRYSQLPRCVIGIASTDGEMLTVVDAGLLLGHAATHSTIKSRLIVMGDGPMNGFGLLVSRVLDLIDHVDMPSGQSALTAQALSDRLARQVPNPKEVHA